MIESKKGTESNVLELKTMVKRLALISTMMDRDWYVDNILVVSTEFYL